MSPNRSRQGRVDLILYRAGVSQVQDMDIVSDLADPLHAPLTLLQA